MLLQPAGVFLRTLVSEVSSVQLVNRKHSSELLRELNGGAWCPAPQISPQTHEYLEVNLRTVHVLTSLATQGRFGNGQGREFAEEFMVEYWRPGLHKWLRYRNRTGHEVESGSRFSRATVARQYASLADTISQEVRRPDSSPRSSRSSLTLAARGS
ncbi:hypothetical protein HPB48_003603 [Haemaphysalis longicornis]|uniref:F5/8 type C domain-containing protein n=1 Tax=Haemaphysalis longicornis TaxID=44386 RepID=A0A9J6FD73_HAELO|nr:hypothetical protein HPB48_003603 [Haemaphysalis longicornis]